jgi:hypothetical protein
VDKRQLGAAVEAGFAVHVDCSSSLVALTRLLVRWFTCLLLPG